MRRAVPDGIGDVIPQDPNRSGPVLHSIPPIQFPALGEAEQIRHGNRLVRLALGSIDAEEADGQASGLYGRGSGCRPPSHPDRGKLA